MFSHVIKVTLIGASLLLSTNTFAVPVQFSFASNTALTTDLLAYHSGSLSLALSAKQISGDTETAVDLYQDSNGIGAYSGGSDNTELDAYGPDESLYLQFNQSVSLLNASFSQIGTNDDFQLFVDDELKFDSAIPGGNASDTGISEMEFTDMLFSGTLFRFAPINTYDDFSLSSITVDFAENPSETTTVPIPASLWLVLSGLGAMLSVRRMQREGSNIDANSLLA
ncbi:MAG: VPLPA-CTERM sorting domain-containing protein [Gammaproteobacteria bacterium]|nr:VPLPA-CTERM sorting domain-containing protein [Gammaproteobacteria bacterium]